MGAVIPTSMYAGSKKCRRGEDRWNFQHAVW